MRARARHPRAAPALIRRISVSPESLREGTAAQQEVAAQPEARLLLAFHRLRRGSAYSRRLAHHKPARGTPVLCLDAVDYCWLGSDACAYCWLGATLSMEAYTEVY